MKNIYKKLFDNVEIPIYQWILLIILAMLLSYFLGYRSAVADSKDWWVSCINYAETMSRGKPIC